MSDLGVQQRLRAALAGTSARLARAGVPSPSVDARALIARAARADGHLLLLDALPEGFEEELDVLTVRREAREPLQLILGQAPFRRLLLRTRPGVFIPRPETELVLDHLLRFARTEPVREVLDLCTGSGAIAAAVLDELPGVRVTAVELGAVAADLARENIAAAAFERDGAEQTPRWELREGDATDAALLADLEGRADAVLTNPPYVPPGAIPREQEVRDHDPALALYGGGEDGLEIPLALLRRARTLLRPGGLLVMEHADVQGPAARALARDLGGFEDVRTAQDLTGRDRFLLARRAGIAEPSARNERLSP